MTAFDYYQQSSNGVWQDDKNNKIIFPSAELSNVAVENLKKISVYHDRGGSCLIFKGLEGTINQELGIWINRDSKITLGAFKYYGKVWITASFGSEIIIGDDVMFARNVTIFSGNNHKLFDYNGTCRNKNKITIGDHVWLGVESKIYAGADIGDGSVIGACAVVAGKIPNNVTAAGNPAKVLSKDIFWLFEQSNDIETNFFESSPYIRNSPDFKYRKKTEENNDRISALENKITQLEKTINDIYRKGENK